MGCLASERPLLGLTYTTISLQHRGYDIMMRDKFIFDFPVAC